jgi:predicted metal-dependent HD superfamily phosphohydrolase
MNWTRIANTELAMAAISRMDTNRMLGCSYHNMHHIEEMYDYLYETNEPYDEALDWAILFHDIVYDEGIGKELRSAKKFVEMADGRFDGCNLRPSEQARVYSLIMRTADHVIAPEVIGSSAIIRADLHGLTKPVDVVYNYMNIMQESMWLYKVDENTFAENSIKFMRNLYSNVEKNMELDPVHREFYKEVKRGIVSTINLSRIIKGDL